jgi:chitin disaccharide deacetylase
MSGSLRRIWLCADDYGIAPGVNAAIRDLIASRRINAISVMVVSPHMSGAAASELLQSAAGTKAAIGLHLTLTAPFQGSEAILNGSASTAFLPIGETLLASALRRFDPARLRAEVDAQFAAFERLFRRPPDFIDGHQHVHLFPQVSEAVLEATKARAAHAWLRQCGQSSFAFRPADPKGMLINFLSRSFRRRAAATGISTNPAFAGTYSFGPEADFAALFPEFLRDLPDGSVVMCHPGHVDVELLALDPLTTLREREYAYLAGAAFPNTLAAAGVALI